MSYQVNYIANIVKNIEVNKLPAIETAINRISKKINITGVDNLIENVNELREEYALLNQNGEITNIKSSYNELLQKYQLFDSSLKTFNNTVGNVAKDIETLKRAYKFITVTEDYLEIESNLIWMKNNFENISLTTNYTKIIDGLANALHPLNYSEADRTEIADNNDYDLINMNLHSVIEKVYELYEKQDDCSFDKEYAFKRLNNGVTKTEKVTPLSQIGHLSSVLFDNVVPNYLTKTEYKRLHTCYCYTVNGEGNVSFSADYNENLAKNNLRQIIKTVAGLDSRFETIDSSIENLTTRVDGLTTSVNTNTTNITTLTTKVDGLTSDVNTNTANISSNTEAISSNTEAISSNTEAITTLRTDVDNLTHSVNNLSEEVIRATADITELNGKVSTLESNINSKVNQTEYDQKITSLETNIDNKVNLSDYNATISILESNINSKVNQTEYDQKIASIEEQLVPTVSKDCLAEEIEYRPYILVSNEAFTGIGLTENDRSLVVTNEAKNILKENSEILNKVENEIDYVVKPKLTNHESRISALETSEPTETVSCLSKILNVAPYKLISDEALTAMGKDLSTFDTTETVEIVAEDAIVNAIEISNRCDAEIDHVIKPNIDSVKERVKAIEDADFETRVSTLETNNNNCLSSDITVQPLNKFSNEAFTELQKTSPDADKTTEVSVNVEQTIKDAYEYATGAIGELQFVANPAINNLKTKVGEFETIEINKIDTTTDTDGQLVYTVNDVRNYTNLVEAIQVNNSNTIKNQTMIESKTNRLSNDVSTITERVEEMSNTIDKITPDKYHTYHMYERLFTTTNDFPAVESAIMFKSGYDVGVTKLKLDVYYGIENKLQITTDMIPEHLKNITTLSVYLILSLNFPETIGNYGFTISNETDLTLKLEKVFIDANNNTNGEANIGDITISNFVVYSNDSVITVSMYNKALRYTLMFDHERGSNVTGINLINIQHNIDDEIPTRTIKFIDNVSQEEFTPTITKVVL